MLRKQTAKMSNFEKEPQKGHNFEKEPQKGQFGVLDIVSFPHPLTV